MSSQCLFSQGVVCGGRCDAGADVSREMDLAAMGAVADWLRRRKPPLSVAPGQACANCRTELQGPYCHACGQLADDFHRSIWKLFWESVENLFNLDGRVLKTLPKLVFDPGGLTRDYLVGRRAPQIPPFRLFLVVLLIGLVLPDVFSGDRTSSPSTPDSAMREAGAQIESGKGSLHIGPLTVAGPRKTAGGSSAGRGDFTVDGGPRWLTDWLQTRLNAVQRNPQLFGYILENWIDKIIVLSLPVSAVILGLLFVFNRRFMLFDHLVFSMHSLSFQILLITTIALLARPFGAWALPLILAGPAHLFGHMRGVYATSIFGTLVRMGLLFVLSLFAFTGLMLLWLALGLNAMGAG